MSSKKAKQEPETLSIRSIYTDYLKEKRIDIRPEFQRELSWNFDNMISMLDNYMVGGFIQNFFLYKLPIKDEKNFEYQCVDGQHRMTVLEYYIENTLFNDEYLYWEDKNTKEKVFYTITEKIQKKYKKNIRELTVDEKKDFLNTKLQFIFIYDVQDIKFLHEQFNLLQNGKNISTIDTLKNIDHPLTDFLRKHEITRKNNIVNYWKDICHIKKIKDFNCVNDITNKNIELFTFHLIKLFYIIDKNSLGIVYNNKKIKICLEEKDKNFELKTNIEELYEKINNYKIIISNLLDKTISPELFLILSHLLNTEIELFKLIDKNYIIKIINEHDIKGIHKNPNDFIETANIIKNKIYEKNKKNI